VPALRAKKDVVPGRTTELWFTVATPGEYPIYCAEYCGLEHSRMRGRVLALTPEEYAKAWDPSPLAGRPPLLAARLEPGAAGASLAEAGERIAAAHGCLRCHTLDGTPHLGPTWAGLYGSRIPLADGRSVVADGPYLTEAMFDPAAKVHQGFEPIMPSYRGELDPTDTGALLELMRSLATRVPVRTAPLVSAGTPPVALPTAEAPGP
jgi:cytochrome c oxidase subunit 2